MSSSEIQMWLQHNSRLIETALANQVKYVYTSRPSNLYLSDLRLCHAVSSMPVPPGFSNKIGTIIEEGSYSPVYHEAHVATDGTTIEYVPGQFFANERTGQSGKQAVLSVAHHLVKILSSEVFIAIGDKQELEQLFRITYLL